MKYTIIWETRKYNEVEVNANSFDEAQAIWQDDAGPDDYIVSIEDERGMKLEYGYNY